MRLPEGGLAFILAIVAAVLALIAFALNLSEGDFDWVPLVMGIVMIGLAVSARRKSRGG